MQEQREMPLGRREEFDERSRNFPIRALIAASAKPRGYTWSCGIHLEQGAIGACVGFSISHELAAKPKPVPNLTNLFAFNLYYEAQKIDPWPGEAYEGTSVLAGIQIAQQRGYFSEYRWSFSLEDLVLAVGYKGPAVIGIPWYDNMFRPDASGFLHPTGAIVGGHAILVKGVSVTGRYFKLHNSWGAWWGKGGDANISFADLESLLHQGGEACIPVTRSLGPK